MTAAEISEEGGEEMSGLNKFTFWRASCVQNPKNCAYPEKVVVTDAMAAQMGKQFCPGDLPVPSHPPELPGGNGPTGRPRRAR